MQKNKTKARRILRELEREYPDAGTSLKSENPFQLLIATILSAQCTDKRVNMVTGELFRQYPAPQDMAAAAPEHVEDIVRSTGFYRNKARNIINASRKIEERYSGKVPRSMEELVSLPGVARKTANIVLYHGFGKNEGIAVDTHVKRLSQRTGITAARDPRKIEKDLMMRIPSRKWGVITDLMINHGRKVCRARRPLCPECVIKDHCDLYSQNRGRNAKKNG
jgi:endonuclease-3